MHAITCIARVAELCFTTIATIHVILTAVGKTPGFTATMAGNEIEHLVIFGNVLGAHLFVATLAFDEVVGAGGMIIANSGNIARLAHVLEHFPTFGTRREDTVNSLEGIT